MNPYRLIQLRKEMGLKQSDLNKISGISKSTISRLESGKAKMNSLDVIAKVATALGTTTDYLLGLTDDKESPTMAQIPVYGSVPAGVPIEALQVDEGYVNVDSDMLRGDKRFIGLKVKGNSMYPFYLEGDTIILEITTDFNSGDDVVVFVGDDYEATLKRIHRKEDHIELEPLNREYPTHSYSENSEPVRVLGVVRELRRSF